jgi:hypothetical protein
LLENHYPGKEVDQAFQPDLQCLSFVRGNGVINEAGCWDYLVGMTSGTIHDSQVPGSGWPLPFPPPIGCKLSTNRKRKPKWRRCVAASIAVGPSAILTGSRTRPSDWGSNARFGPVEDRRNNRRPATFTCTLSVLLTSKIFEAYADFLTPDGLGSCRKRRNFGAHPSFVQSCACGLAALGSPDLILQIWWLSPFTSPAHVLAHRIADFFSLRSTTEDHRPESGIDHGVPAMRRSDKPESPVLRSPTSCDISDVPFSLLVPFSHLLRYQ